MDSLDLKSAVHGLVDKLDTPFLEVVYSMLDTYLQQREKRPIVAYDLDGTPRTALELAALLDKEATSALKGEVIPLDKLKKQFSEWGRNIQ